MNFKQRISAAYPPGNNPIFEEWFAENYRGCKTERELLPIYPTSFHVNNGYGAKRADLQAFCDSLDESKKYFLICQYDDGCMVDWNGKDVLEFNMSKKVGAEMPLLCKPQPYVFHGNKKRFANFIGNKTHPIRDGAAKLESFPGYYISFNTHDIQTYCKIIYESLFTLCYRGYGTNSFRIAEAMQYGSIPVYISDEFIKPFDADFEQCGVIVKEEDAGQIDEILRAIPVGEIIRKQDNIPVYYKKYYTYEGAMAQIIKVLESE